MKKYKRITDEDLLDSNTNERKIIGAEYKVSSDRVFRCYVYSFYSGYSGTDKKKFTFYAGSESSIYLSFTGNHQRWGSNLKELSDSYGPSLQFKFYEFKTNLDRVKWIDEKKYNIYGR